MKVNIVGASHFINRMHEACGKYQWAREFLCNSLEAHATHIEFGIEWQAVAKHGIYRRTIVDNGIGMTADELYKFFRSLGAGAKTIGGVHDNFGVGAKIASLPWNPNGVVVVTWKGGKASMIWIVLDSDSEEYELVEFVDGDEVKCTIDPNLMDWHAANEIDWGAIKPDFINDHGTVIVLLGGEHQDTVIGNPDASEGEIKGLSAYLNTRFWSLTDTKVIVTELRSGHKPNWPAGPRDKDDKRRPNNRRIHGAKYYLEDVKSPDTCGLKATGVCLIDDERVLLTWYLWEGKRPQIHAYAQERGYIVIKYKGELFQMTTRKVDFRHFGVIEGAVQKNLTLIIEPQHYQPNADRWGVHPDQSRHRLIFTGHGEKGTDIPLVEWGLEFAEHLPEPILEAITKARGDIGAEIEDEEYRKRLQDKFGSRWSMKALIKPPEKCKASPLIAGELTGDQIPIKTQPEKGIKRKTTRKTIARKLPEYARGKERNNSDQLVEKEVAVDVPRIYFDGKDSFEREWHLAMWAPNHPKGPAVVINVESPILEEAVKYHQELYPPIHAENVGRVVQQVFGEVVACKVAHSQKLTKEIPEEEINAEYRSEQALTIALMGLLAEESLIAHRLGRFGRRIM